MTKSLQRQRLVARPEGEEERLRNSPLSNATGRFAEAPDLTVLFESFDSNGIKNEFYVILDAQ